MIPVLIVDDSLTVRMDLHEAFAGAGFDAVPCADGACARQALAARDFSLVVLDVQLPDGDGLELLAEIRRSPRHARTPVVLLSTAAEVGDRIRGLEVGADEYVGKPYDAAAVVTRARELVRRAEGGEAPGEARDLVLVVDDSITVREELREELERAGLDVVTAPDGEEGLRIAADRRPSAVVVDGAMPGMDGATFIRHVRSDSVLRTTPCMLLTASESVGELRALDAGADAYVRKEEGNEVVLARLQALLRWSGPPAELGISGLLSPKRVLVIAHARERSAALAERIRGAGHEPVAVCSVDEALALAAVDRLDAIAVDASDPVAVALAACTRIKAVPALRDVPLLVVGEGEAHELVLQAIHAGADDYVGATSGSGVLRARIAAQLRRKQFEDENRLREGYARNSAILESISDAFFAVDRGWRLVYVNHAFEELLGTTRAAAVGESLWSLTAPLEAGLFEQELRRAASQGAPLTFEAPFPEERWFEVRAFPREDGLTAYLRDVTERRRSQEVQAHLLGIVGHDLRTPLTSIMISAGSLVRDPKLSERQHGMVRRIEAVTEHMTRLIQDLLDYSRARLGRGLSIHPGEADLDAICREALDQVRAAHAGRTVVYRPEGDGHGRWDPDRILQVLMNLLTNALRHGAPDREVTLSWRAEAGRKVICVHNHGAPIPAALQGQIFEPFRRGEAAVGTRGSVGLGLYIVKQIVAAHGGAVRVRSAEPEGTTFEVVLPAAAPV